MYADFLQQPLSIEYVWKHAERELKYLTTYNLPKCFRILWKGDLMPFKHNHVAVNYD